MTDPASPTVPDSEGQAKGSDSEPLASNRGSESLRATADGNEPSAAHESQTPDPEAELRSEIGRLKEQLLRTLADFDNYRKRSRREIADAERAAREDQLRELLPVFDNLERASQHAAGSADVNSLAEGIQMVIRQFADALSRIGAERVVTVGQAFDPTVHEAIQHLETQEHPPGVIAAEVLAGYRMGDRLVRPALVVVAKPPADD